MALGLRDDPELFADIAASRSPSAAARATTSSPAPRGERR
jgi:hypothetical protein